MVESKSSRSVGLSGSPIRTKKSASSSGAHELECVSRTIVTTPAFGGSGIITALKSDSPSSCQYASDSRTTFRSSLLIAHAPSLALGLAHGEITFEQRR